MKVFRHLMVAGALAVSSVSALAADKVINYTIDPTHTQVRFSWDHVGFSTPGAVFKEVNGTIVGNHTQPAKSSVEVHIPVRSLDSFVPLLNEHLLDTGDYFDTKKYPTITFKSTGIKDLNEKDRTFKLLGDLTVNGVTKAVTLNAKAKKVGGHPFYGNAEAAGFDATTVIKRSEFNVGKSVPVVGDELTVDITVEAIEADAWKKAQEKKPQ